MLEGGGGVGGEGEGVEGRDLKWAQGLPQAVSQMMTWKKNFEPAITFLGGRGKALLMRRQMQICSLC